MKYVVHQQNSPWQNGRYERNYYIVDVCVKKMIDDDPGMKLDVALAWAVNAKNSMQNHNGFSPIYLVLGTSLNLPLVSTNRLPSMENPEKSEAVTKHLTALHAARRAFESYELQVDYNIGDKDGIRPTWVQPNGLSGIPYQVNIADNIY